MAKAKTKADSISPEAPESIGIEAPSDGGVLNRLRFSLDNLMSASMASPTSPTI